jgi:lipopolysaccharide/colanic/teichoic acid biosynthesis glycosyltransferase
MPIRPLRLDTQSSVTPAEPETSDVLPDFARPLRATEIVVPSDALRVVVGGAPPATRERGTRRKARRPARDRSYTFVAQPPRWRLLAKRTIDVIGGVVGLALFALPLAVLAVLIRLGSRGRPIFAHERIGRGGRPFRCYKLRTMCVDAEARLADDGPLRDAYHAHHFKLPTGADPRVTPLGRFLRMSSLDEIPQFWNVIRGDMSLVGPRPVVPNELTHYATTRDVLLSVRPGLTGAWAVRGRSRVGYPQRAGIELEYVRSWTLAGDFAILLRTIGVVLQRKGAY